MELGEKIRRRRKELRLTQEELAGDCITRNMLSQIEKGKATPSLQTIVYLAEKLGMPVGYFFCEEDEEFFFRKQLYFPRLLSLYRAGSYAECITLFERELGECDDELGLLLADSAFRCGKRAWQNGAMNSAAAYLSSAMEFAGETVYPADYIRAGVNLLLPIALNVQSPLLEFNAPAYIDSLRRAGCLDEYRYLTEDDQSYVFENEFYAAHLRAKGLMKDRYYTEALTHLCGIEEHKGDPQITAFLLFRVYGDMETCYRENGNYEEAYRYSTKRMSMLAAFRT